MSKKNIFDLEKSQFKKYFEKNFRYEQMFNWIFKKNIYSFGEMTNLPKFLRENLEKEIEIINLNEIKVEKSIDKSTEKYLFKTKEGNYIESVYMKYENRNTLCISTQIGCRRNCKFCATGAIGFKRNLKTSEIISQILYFPEVTNVVFMGMGEPLDNYKNLKKTLGFLNSEKFMNMGARRITISTIGIPSKIEKLAELNKQFGLSWSLHTTRKSIREKLMPSTKTYKLNNLVEGFKYYKKVTNADITIEYILIKDVNMNRMEADNLYEISKKLDAKINFIPYNEHRYANFSKPSKKEISKFLKYYKDKNIFFSIRESKGQNISAACGQLSGKTEEVK